MEIFEQIAGLLFLALLTPFMILMGIFVTLVAAVESLIKHVIKKYM